MGLSAGSKDVESRISLLARFVLHHQCAALFNINNTRPTMNRYPNRGIDAGEAQSMPSLRLPSQRHGVHRAQPRRIMHA
ncbi:hypothetical protein LFL97_22940 [Burkholderia sp. JSH-S8]|uniref:hypothetical protein n=1 Tax=Burkholderia stagnalis TaxID=1503054 RepID=UPI000B27C27E|nr:hypothetical protein [Burkholderia stagnalis]WGS45589.1 hypothetical protein LFL97_22940 [Burkholderia sp. JSH-S8]